MKCKRCKESILAVKNKRQKLFCTTKFAQIDLRVNDSQHKLHFTTLKQCESVEALFSPPFRETVTSKSFYL